ncbi:spermatogenesis-associated protein 20 isoform X1 [Malaya genurostris]|uniref:spermatogenesis-associated protein 20 isoform X1 n=2 Tax=Malaya genurostris TaxID=325434 RepID=UPI0026F38753|nr:spermatogenesis-associated protein 20 isoform X1 [Malaya genurostris]
MFQGVAAKVNHLAGYLRTSCFPTGGGLTKSCQRRTSFAYPEGTAYSSASENSNQNNKNNRQIQQHPKPVGYCHHHCYHHQCRYYHYGRHHQNAESVTFTDQYLQQVRQRVQRSIGQVCKFCTNTISMSSNSPSGSSGDQKHTNRLINEKSPYLLQHAHNPVDWYPWCQEAIDRAKAENKLIFLSVGYSTCHWCHVMEKESFENEEVAKIMNENFINVKVDREERPDIDKLYMTFILLINGSGGWPMSVWLTPDLAPVTGGTYFPPKDRWGMPGFSTILLKLKNKWLTDSEDLASTGRSIIDAIQKNVEERHKEEPERALTAEEKFKQSNAIYKRNFDPVWGGSLGAPKFPEVSKLNLMFHSHIRDPAGKILGVVLNTLDKMAAGGIHDHVFGGFARYSVDKKWHVPHFEKMLYDQGQLLMAYSNGYKTTKKQLYLDVADSIFNYICKDLQHPAGGFYSGEDADSLPTWESSDKIEGAFYAWTYAEVRDLLKPNLDKFGDIGEVDPVDVYTEHYNIQETGNVEPSSDPHGHLLGKNILIVYGSVGETADKCKTSSEVVSGIVKVGNAILHEVRDKRPRPHLDTKIICAWNGLILSGLSQLACIKDAPNREKYLQAATSLVSFIRENLFDMKARKLLRSCYGDDTEKAKSLEHPIYGFIDDYAFLIKGLTDYYRASLDKSALWWGKELQEIQDQLFWDQVNGAYFYSEANSSNVVVRLKEDHDGAEPCGNSVSVHNLLLLGDYFESESFHDKAKKILNYFSNVTPFGYVLPEMMSAMLLDCHGRDMLVVVGPDGPRTDNLIDAVRDFYMPGLTIVRLNSVTPDQHLAGKTLKSFRMLQDAPTAYFCHNKVCQMPVTDPARLTEDLIPKHIFDYTEYEN